MDFTKYVEENKLLKVYSGANGAKRGFKMGDTAYMLKSPSHNHLVNDVYSNSSVSEYMGCEILSSLGMETQNTILGEIHLKGNKRICVACEDFEVNGFRLYHFSSIKNDDLDTDSKGNNTELEEVLEAIDKQRFVPVNEVKSYFWNLFIGDALIGNPDRHNGNWGFLINENTQEVKLSPIYDCGSSLSSLATDEKMTEILSSRKEIDNRIFVSNRSSIKLNNKRISYYLYLMSTDNEDCLKAICNIVPKVDMKKINDIIENTPYTSEIAKRFHKTILKERYEKMLLPALERAKEIITLREINP